MNAADVVAVIFASAFAAMGVVAASVITGLLPGARQARHIRSLQAEVRSLGGEDRWSVPCSHCGRPIRDENSRTCIRRYERSDGGWEEVVRGTYHSDRPACAAAALDVEAGR